MYNRYIPNCAAYTRVTEEEHRHTDTPGREAPSSQEENKEASTHHAASWLGGLLKRLRLEDLDSGDILLLLILLFLFVDGDDLELLITLALLILLGLGGKEDSG